MRSGAEFETAPVDWADGTVTPIESMPAQAADDRNRERDMSADGLAQERCDEVNNSVDN